MTDVMDVASNHSGVMNIMDPTGHTEIKWDKNNSGDVTIAREAFRAMKDKGYHIFEVNRGAQGKRASDFDPNAEKYMVFPQHVGG